MVKSVAVVLAAMPFVRSEYNYDRDAASDESALRCLDPSRTQQSQAEEADINVIVKRFGVTGVLPQNVQVPLNVDFDATFDYRTALDLIREADQAFMKMPAEVRSRFENDAGLFVDFVSDPANIEEVRKLGLAVPIDVKEEPPIMRVQVVNPEASPEPVQK